MAIFLLFRLDSEAAMQIQPKVKGQLKIFNQKERTKKQKTKQNKREKKMEVIIRISLLQKMKLIPSSEACIRNIDLAHHHQTS
jgi:hypothetical protein